MAIRLMPDGSKHFDTVEEVLDYEEAKAARAARDAAPATDVGLRGSAALSGPKPALTVVSVATQVDAATDPLGHVPVVDPAAGSGCWTKLLAEHLFEALDDDYRALTRDALRVDSGTPALEFSEKTGHDSGGVGRRFKKLANEAKRVAPDLPPPVRFGGKPGAKFVEIEPSFATAARKVFDASA